MSPSERLPEEGATGSAPRETPATDTPTPASAEAFKKLRRDRLELFMVFGMMNVDWLFASALKVFLNFFERFAFRLRQKECCYQKVHHRKARKQEEHR